MAPLGRPDGRTLTLAIYHLRAKAVSRQIKNPKPGGSTRRSAVAAAAYRSGERLYDNLQAKWFTRAAEEGHTVEHSAILAPEGAPPALLDRAQLWNLVERREMNADGTLKEGAQLYREIEITLPRELSRDERVALVEGYVRDQFVSKGMIADLSIHNKTGSTGFPQPHAHIMLTMRRVETNPAKIEAAQFFGGKERDWNIPASLYAAIAQSKKAIGQLQSEAQAQGMTEARSAALVAARETLVTLQADMPLMQWRAAWTKAANAALAAASQPARIDHRTLVAQREEALAQGDHARAAALNREPQKPLGVAGHLEDAYRFMKDRIATWVAVEQRARMARYLQAMQGRDPMKAAEMLERLNEWRHEVIDRFNDRGGERDLVPEVRLER